MKAELWYRVPTPWKREWETLEGVGVGVGVGTLTLPTYLPEGAARVWAPCLAGWTPCLAGAGGVWAP